MGSKPSKNRGQKITPNSSELFEKTAKRTPATPNSDTSTFAVITVIFNPIKYQSRYNHYEKFVAHMVESGVRLITVECLFESTTRFNLPEQKFEITRSNDPCHIQLRAPSILWLKENLINIAVQQLPPHIEFVAWIDADIEFERLDWPQLAINELRHYPIVQLFEVAHFLGPNGKNEILRRDYSMGYSIRHNKPITPSRSEWYAHPGYAWAMRRTAFADIGGLLDFCIIGSGDLHFAYALLHRIEETIRASLHRDYRQLAIEWGDKVAQVAGNGRNVSYVPVNLCHHWHGERNDRNYVNRWEILAKHQFSPVNDLIRHSEIGLLRLVNKNTSTSYARIESMEADIVEYFKSRNEDSTMRTTVSPSRQDTKYVAPPQKQSYRSGLQSSRSQSRRDNDNYNYWPYTTDNAYCGDYNLLLCTCHGLHNVDNHHCPSTSHQIDDKQCWDSTEHHQKICLPTNDDNHHHRTDENHHHRTDDNHHHCTDDNHHHRIDERHSSHDTHEHASFSNDCNTGHTDERHSSHDTHEHAGFSSDSNTGYTYDGREDSSQHYDGPGSFY